MLLHHRSENALCLHEIEPVSVDIHSMSNNGLGPLSTNVKHFLHLGESHELLMLNGLHCFPESEGFTCFPHSRGASVVDYVLANQNLILYIRQFSILQIP
jgi:hypothetical protein